MLNIIVNFNGFYFWNDLEMSLYFTQWKPLNSFSLIYYNFTILPRVVWLCRRGWCQFLSPPPSSWLPGPWKAGPADRPGGCNRTPSCMDHFLVCRIRCWLSFLPFLPFYENLRIDLISHLNKQLKKNYNKCRSKGVCLTNENRKRLNKQMTI